ncbi:unnamed protein product [Ceratitis capitata]|uniref:(Mediterranean fruit fly) hypothetical protein n=1 Tax=Ceratitis capitata TaxID=7213 RepID=A0A811UX78_CERCA|nr:unnamed protein product [Ceratitis capitata]
MTTISQQTKRLLEVASPIQAINEPDSRRTSTERSTISFEGLRPPLRRTSLGHGSDTNNERSSQSVEDLRPPQRLNSHSRNQGRKESAEGWTEVSYRKRKTENKSKSSKSSSISKLTKGGRPKSPDKNRDRLDGKHTSPNKSAKADGAHRGHNTSPPKVRNRKEVQKTTWSEGTRTRAPRWMG